MRVYEVTYGMGGIATGGYFKSLVAAHKQDNVRGLLNEEHAEDVSIMNLEVTEKKIFYL